MGYNRRKRFFGNIFRIKATPHKLCAVLPKKLLCCKKGDFCMNIAVAQSGGPTCAINASLVGVFRESLKEPAIDAIFGSVNGVEDIEHTR